MKIRLFSICFSLMLVLLFLPGSALAGQVSEQASVIQVDNSEVLRPDDKIPVTIFLLDETASFVPTGQGRVYVWAEAANGESSFRSTALANSDSNSVRSFFVQDGKAECDLSFVRSGNYTIHASLRYPGTSNNVSTFETEYKEGQEVVVEERRASVKRMTVAYQGYVEQNLLDGESAHQALVVHPGGVADFTAALSDDQGRRVGSGMKVSAWADDPSIIITPDIAETNISGEVTFRVSGFKTGDFKVYVEAGKHLNTLPLMLGTKEATMTIGSPTMLVNGEATSLDVSPVVVNDRTYVPYRALAEAFGAKVDWYEPLQQVRVSQGTNIVTMQIGSKVNMANGLVKNMDVAPFIQKGRTMVPVRFMAESLGYKVSYTSNPDGSTKTVTFVKG